MLGGEPFVARESSPAWTLPVWDVRGRGLRMPPRSPAPACVRILDGITLDSQLCRREARSAWEDEVFPLPCPPVSL